MAVRRHFISGLGWFEEDRVLEAFELMLDGTLKIEESLGIFRGALGRRETREAVYRLLQKGYDKLEKLMPRMMLPYTMQAALPFCDVEHRDDMVAFYTPKLDSLPGGDKMMTEVREAMDVCIAQRKLHAPGLEAFLARY
jgi:hypothetical protein